MYPKPVVSKAEWEIYITLSITSNLNVLEARKKTEFLEGIGIFLTGEPPTDKTDDLSNNHFFGYKENYSGIGILF